MGRLAGRGQGRSLEKAVQSEDVCRLTRWKQPMEAALFGPGRFASDGLSDADGRTSAEDEGQHETDELHLMHPGLSRTEA